MLHDLNTLVGTSIIATDGEIGTVREFLFDDRSWRVRYLVVDVGDWFQRRAVVLAIADLEQPDWAKKCFKVHFTREQVRESPDIDTEKPVTRQQEIAMEQYYGQWAAWVDREMGLASSMPTGITLPVSTAEDEHLRGAWALWDYEVWAVDGDLGRLQGFIMDEATWHLGYLEVKAGDWLHSRSMLIPTGWVESVSWANHRVNLHHTRTGV